MGFDVPFTPGILGQSKGWPTRKRLADSFQCRPALALSGVLAGKLPVYFFLSDLVEEQTTDPEADTLRTEPPGPVAKKSSNRSCNRIKVKSKRRESHWSFALYVVNFKRRSRPITKHVFFLHHIEG